MYEIINPTITSGRPRLDFNAMLRLADDRMHHGLAPPPAIYRIEYRNRVDWSLYPTWAWPVDPEVFDRCCHEG